MKEYIFNNRVWIGRKGRIIDRLCIYSAVIFLMLSCVQVVLGSDQVNFPMIIFSFILLGIGNSNKKRSGKYLKLPCRIVIREGSMDWFYEKADLQDGKGIRNIHYHIIGQNIDEILLSEEMKSIRMTCKLDVDIEYGEGKKYAFHKNNRKSILVIYADEINEIAKSINQYLYSHVEICDEVTRCK